MRLPSTKHLRISTNHTILQKGVRYFIVKGSCCGGMKCEKRYRTTEAKPVVLDKVFRFDTFLVFYQGSAPGYIGLTALLAKTAQTVSDILFPFLHHAIDRKEGCAFGMKSFLNHIET